jgi:surfactin synthase thioesterase subunit
LIRATGAEPVAELIDLWVEVLVADLEASRRYRKATPTRLPCSITVLGWTRDREVPPGLLGGWSAWGDASWVLLDGEHYTFLSAPEPLRREIAAAIGRGLGSCEPSSS